MGRFQKKPKGPVMNKAKPSVPLIFRKSGGSLTTQRMFGKMPLKVTIGVCKHKLPSPTAARRLWPCEQNWAEA